MPQTTVVPTKGVTEIVEETRAIRWWIDKQIAAGHSDEEIEAMLPTAVAVITGKLLLSTLLTRLAA